MPVPSAEEPDQKLAEIVRGKHGQGPRQGCLSKRELIDAVLARGTPAEVRP